LYWISGKFGKEYIDEVHRIFIRSGFNTSGLRFPLLVVQPLLLAGRERDAVQYKRLAVFASSSDPICGKLRLLSRRSIRDPTNPASDTEWPFNHPRDTLIDIVRGIPATTHIFIDGLDEVSPEDGIASLLQVLDDINALSNTKICISSRPEPQLRRSNRWTYISTND
jgi:hypothetical protein